MAAIAQQAQDSVLAFRKEHASSAQEHKPYTGSITVCIRERPISEEERQGCGITLESGCERRDTHEFECVTACNPDVFYHELSKVEKVESKKYTYHHVFRDTSTNEDIYAAVVSDLVPYALDMGGVSTVIAYGQTGAGKTFTQVSMQEQLTRDLFKLVAQQGATSSEGDGLKISISFFENQGDRLFDLQNERAELALREDADGHMQVGGLTTRLACNEEEATALIFAANALRASEPTQSNPHSSRSHAICEFKFEPSGGSIRVVDLAGSERRQDVSDHSYERVMEMKDINWSLGCLKECIRLQRESELKAREGKGQAALSKGADDAPPSKGEDGTVVVDAPGTKEGFVPYRRSKLTMLLKDCLTRAGRENGSKTVFIGHVSPMASSSGYTQNTLLYTQELLALGEKKAASAGSTGAIVLPEKWSKLRFTKWMEKVDDGRYASFVESFQITGATFKNMPPGSNIGGMVPRICAAGGTEEDASALQDAFRKETLRLKKAQAAAAKSGS